jgi:hypothetical protein
VDYTITYYSETVQADILNLPDKTPPRERRIAEARMKEVKHANS